MRKSISININSCLYIQAYGLRACEGDKALSLEPCPFDYYGDPPICGGKAFKRLIKKGEFPRKGRVQVRWFLAGVDYAKEQIAFKKSRKGNG